MLQYKFIEGIINGYIRNRFSFFIPSFASQVIAWIQCLDRYSTRAFRAFHVFRAHLSGSLYNDEWRGGRIFWIEWFRLASLCWVVFRSREFCEQRQECVWCCWLSWYIKWHVGSINDRDKRVQAVVCWKESHKSGWTLVVSLWQISQGRKPSSHEWMDPIGAHRRMMDAKGRTKRLEKLGSMEFDCLDHQRHVLTHERKTIWNKRFLVLLMECLCKL